MKIYFILPFIFFGIFFRSENINSFDKPFSVNITGNPLTANMTDKPLTANITDKPLTANITDKPLTANITDKPLIANMTDDANTTTQGQGSSTVFPTKALYEVAKKNSSNYGLTIGLPVGIVVIVGLFVSGVFIYKKYSNRHSYTPAPKKDNKSNLNLADTLGVMPSDNPCEARFERLGPNGSIEIKEI